MHKTTDPSPRSLHDQNDPHAGQPVRSAGTPLAEAHIAVVMVHGRGASAESILTLAPILSVNRVAFLAPQASGGTWYPYSFMAPIDQNEPGITSGMHAIQRVVDDISAAGIPLDHTMLLGFSQGACLATEYAARHAMRYAGIISLSGGLIGPDGTSRDYTGSLDGTPVFFGCSDIDSHIPATRVRESAKVFQRIGGDVTMRLYPGMGHLVNEDEITTVRGMLATALAE
jgi:predicted esterase